MRLPMLALATGLTVAGLAAPAVASVNPLPSYSSVVVRPQTAATTAPVAPPAVVDTAPVFAPEGAPGPFAYPAVFLVPIALLAGAGWSVRALTRDLLPAAA